MMLEDGKSQGEIKQDDVKECGGLGAYVLMKRGKLWEEPETSIQA